jgi:hypothetical protein
MNSDSLDSCHSKDLLWLSCLRATSVWKFLLSAAVKILSQVEVEIPPINIVIYQLHLSYLHLGVCVGFMACRKGPVTCSNSLISYACLGKDSVQVLTYMVHEDPPSTIDTDFMFMAYISFDAAVDQYSMTIHRGIRPTQGHWHKLDSRLAKDIIAIFCLQHPTVHSSTI